MSLITLDRDLWRRVEPGTPSPASRLRAIERLSTAGVSTSVFLMPILPGLTDQPANLDAVIQAAADHGASRVIAAPLRLAPGVKEWFLDYLRVEFPRLTSSYERGYVAGADSPGWYRARLEHQVESSKRRAVFAAPAASRRAPRVGQQYLLDL